MILGRIIGKVSTTNFEFKVETGAKKFMFVQVNHPEYGYTLCQIVELFRDSEKTIAKCTILGYVDSEGKVRSLRSPFAPGSEVLKAEDDTIKRIVLANVKEGAYIGYLDGKTIPVKINLQKLLTTHVAVLAKSGSGKSYTVGVLVEEIMKKGIPLLIIDPHGEFGQLRYANDEDKEKQEFFGVEAKGFADKIQEYGDMSINANLKPLKLSEDISSSELINLLPQNLSNTQEALLFSTLKDMDPISLDRILLELEEMDTAAKWSLMEMIRYLQKLNIFSSTPTPLNELIQPGKCSIINLRGVDPFVQELIVSQLLRSLFSARKKEQIPPFFCVIEEAHNFCPERGFGKARSSSIIRTVASEGRKFGLGLAVVSQRPARVEKNVLSQCSTQFILKITNPGDVKAITSSVDGITAATENEITNLPIGVAMVCGVVDMPLFVSIRPRMSKHGGSAVEMISQAEEEPAIDIEEETRKFEEKNLMSIIKPKFSIKDIKLMATKEIKSITTYLIPAIYVTVLLEGEEFAFLVDKIKGKIVVDPEKEVIRSIDELYPKHAFYHKPEYLEIPFDKKLSEQLCTQDLKNTLSLNSSVQDVRECFIVHRKVDYGRDVE